MSSLIVHGFGPSLYVRKVRFVLEFKKLNYEIDPCFPSQAPEFLDKSPLGKVPYLTDGNFNIADSTVICQYLEKAYPENPIYPSDAKDYARCLFLEELADTTITQVFGSLFFHKVGGPSFFKLPVNEDRIKELEAQVDSTFARIEKLVMGKDYLLDSRLTLADMSFITVIHCYLDAGYKIDGDKFPESLRYTKALLAEDCISKVFTGVATELNTLLA